MHTTIAPLISFVVPLYNCAPYISACIDSLLHQGLSDGQYEIVVVDDGSRDDGPRIVAALAAAHPGIRMVSQSNSGLGMARNTGVEHSCGVYVCFVDADDLLVPGAMGRLMELVDPMGRPVPPDLVLYDWVYFTDGDPAPGARGDMGRIDFEGTLLDYGNNRELYPSANRQLYRRSLIQDLRFGKYRFAEDVDFTTRLCMRTDAQVVAVPCGIYCYRMRKGSMIHNYSKDYIETVLRCLVEIKRGIDSEGRLSAYSRECHDHFVFTYLQITSVLKLLSARFSLAEIRRYLGVFADAGLLPFLEVRNKVVESLVYITRHPRAFYLYSMLYRNIYLRYIKK